MQLIPPYVESVEFLARDVAVLVRGVPLRKGKELLTRRKKITGSTDMYFHMRVRGNHIDLMGVTLPNDNVTWIGSSFLTKDYISTTTYREVLPKIRFKVKRLMYNESLEFNVL